ncbi:MAG: primosomal protein N' [Syntrophaceae bacterium]
MFVSVAVNIPSFKTFSYAVPPSLQKEITIGKRVLIPFGKRKLTGYIIDVSDSTSREDIKDICEVLDFEPLFNESDLKFYQWVSQYYIYPIGKALAEILPGGIDRKSDRWVSLSQEKPENTDTPLSVVQQKIIDMLHVPPSGMLLTRLKKMTGKNDIRRDINILHNAGFIQIEDKTRNPEVILKKEKIIILNTQNAANKKLTKKQALLIDFLRLHTPVPIVVLRENFKNVLPMLRNLEEQGVICIIEEEVSRRHGLNPDIGNRNSIIILNEDQEDALHEIAKGIESKKFSPYLLHGVTGSGKTEVYLNAVSDTLKMDGGVIILVPEIALTPQLLTRFNARFNSQETAVLHSGISKSVRYDQWRRIQIGDIKVVIGARSAIFAPVRNLKLVIVDEEHDTSYKQDDRMRYNARDLAIMKAKMNSATVVVGSATPAIQTYFNTMKKKYKYLLLPRRVEDRPLPEVEIMDMRREEEVRDKDSIPVLSRTLTEAIEDTLQQNHQALIFLNRRGFHTFLFCCDCGYSFSCLSCSVSMTYHAGEGNLKCHYCDFTTPLPSSCPKCRGKRIRNYGVGTEKLEEEVKKLFPNARIARMDSDTTVQKGASEKILQAFDRREIDILVGTQMITKGHDFPFVTLVGVISADTSLNIPDFRAAERTFQLLTQVAGRGGRGESPGKVIVQTFNPRHYAITRAREHDYIGFYEDEIALRSTLSYPPFSRIINLHLSSLKKERVEEGIQKLKQHISAMTIINTVKGKIEIIGPTESPIGKIKGRYRWQLLLKGKDTFAVNRVAQDILSKAPETGLDIKIDVDPVNFM